MSEQEAPQQQNPTSPIENGPETAIPQKEPSHLRHGAPLSHPTRDKLNMISH